MPFFQAGSLAPAAGFSSSVIDLAKFASWQFKTLEVIDDPILNGNTLKEMQRIHWVDPDGTNTWGLGFGVEKLDNDTFVFHSGGCPGYLSLLILIPKKKWAFIVMVNGLGIDTYQYVEGMYHILASHINEKDEEIALQVNLADYSGNYFYFSTGESIVVPWKGKLAAFCLQSPNQKKPDLLMKHIEGDIFKRIRDDRNLGEEIKFERNEKGKVIRYWHHYQYAEKLVHKKEG